MIEKKRLKELIEKGAKIFYFDAYGDDNWGIVEVDTKNFSFSHNENCYTNFCEATYRTNPQPYKMYEDALFETKEEAEWDREFGCIVRTEILKLPTWEEFIEMEEFCFFQKNHKQTIIRILGTKYLGVETNFERYYTGDLTKENYTLACRKAKELFLGEKK